MSVLLDTCALIALASGTLPPAAAKAVRRAPDVLVSVVSPWEIAIKVAAGKLRLAQPPGDWFGAVSERYALRVIPLDAPVACAAAALPKLHGDPFDRVIVALALANRVSVVTSDEHIGRYPGVTTLW